jgi:hypothetical protein
MAYFSNDKLSKISWEYFWTYFAGLHTPIYAHLRVNSGVNDNRVVNSLVNGSVVSLRIAYGKRITLFTVSYFVFLAYRLLLFSR